MAVMTHNLGFPRIGENRELKKSTESFWKGELSEEELLRAGAEIRRKNWLLQKNLGIDLLPSNDFSFYDQMLDMACLLGAVPERFGWHGGRVGLDLYFAMARGETSSGIAPLEMTKWFDTNYHYLVPEFRKGQSFTVSTEKPFEEFAEAARLGIQTVPALIGPLTFLFLGKESGEGFDRLSLLDKLVPAYVEILCRLSSLGAEWIRLDEPCLILDLTPEQERAYLSAYRRIGEAAPAAKILLASYFGPLSENLELKLSLPAAAYHFDLVRGGEDLDSLLKAFPEGASLSLGVVNGRNVWRNDYRRSMTMLQKAAKRIGPKRIMVAPSCSLMHVPVTLAGENRLEPALKKMLSFATEKLDETAELAALVDGSLDAGRIEENGRLHESWQKAPGISDPEVRRRLARITPEDLRRASPFPERRKKQQKLLPLPLFPTTTTGSFPQTGPIRAARRKVKKGEISATEYEGFLKGEIARLIAEQEELGIDVLVHGEFERNDMVEHFAELLDGFAFMTGGWVQSFGSRYVKPPIIFGDVKRPEPMTLGWIGHAQSLTAKPVKGMLTGPVTMLQWSFAREDLPRSETAGQLALALRDEVSDLEAAGARAIQIDEPALREGLPFKKKDWACYLDWAVQAFRLASCGVKDETQIHTHMCYSEFNDIIDAIIAMDADVLAIEASRSKMELLDAFEKTTYPNLIGPGVYDIHSPRVPDVQEVVDLLEKACRVLPADKVWVNPDCGLKTRGEEEVRASLRNIVEAARIMRARYERS